MKKADFLNEVKEEIDHIKSKATKKEIARLDFATFQHDHASRCIYGQMTGNCDSVRSLKLQKKTYRRISKKGITTKLFYRYVEQDTDTKGGYYTALEKYLFLVHADMHEKIIKYLKGELKKLTLK